MPEKEAVEEKLTDTAQNPDRNPFVFIVGCARSGTTLMHRMVDAHPLVAITPETHWISNYLKNEGSDLGGMVTSDLVSQLARHKRFAQFEMDRRDFENLVPHDEKVLYKEFFDRLFGLYGRVKDRPLVGNKTPAYVRSIRTLHDLWPQARFVHLIRDGRDVCLSILNWKKADRTAGRHATWEEDPVSTTALWWERKVRLGQESGAALEPGLYKEIRYESLVAEPAAECAALCEFLEIPYDAAMVRFHEGKTRTDLPDPRRTPKKAWLPATSGMRNWHTEMAEEEVERFEAASGGLLAELGYERAFPEPSPAAKEHAGRIREEFEREVRARKGRMPERW